MSVLPRIFWTIGERAVDLNDDWSAAAQANIGFDQMRGTLAAAAVRGLGSAVSQGSIVRGYTEYGALMWEGRLSSRPKILQSGTASFAAQGHGAAAAKDSTRMLFGLTGPSAFVDGSQPPFYRAPDSSNISLSSTVNTSITTLKDNRQLIWNVSAAGGTHYDAVLWVPGSRITRFTAEEAFGVPGAGGDYFLASTADGPSASTRSEAKLSSVGVVDVTFAAPGELLVLSLRNDTSISGGNKGLTGITVYGESASTLQYSDDAARTVARKLGWGTDLLGRGGVSVLPLDWSSDKASLLTYLAGLDDFVWGRWENSTFGNRFTFEPWGTQVWEVSGDTGARWDLDPLEVYNQAVVTYTPQAVNVYGQSAVQVQVLIKADPDPLADKGIVNKLALAVSDEQGSSDLPVLLGARSLAAMLQQRLRGSISCSSAFDASTGRNACYEVRPGSLVRIRDFGGDGSSVTLRVMSVAYTPRGIQIGAEMPAIVSALGGLSTGASNIGQAAPLAAPSGKAAVLPYGSPGSAQGGRSFTEPGGHPGVWRR